MDASRKARWTRFGSTILLVSLAVAACAPGHDQQEISATCFTLTSLQPMSKPDALAYLKGTIPDTVAKTTDDQGPEVGVMRDGNGNVLQKTTYTRVVDEQRIAET